MSDTIKIGVDIVGEHHLLKFQRSSTLSELVEEVCKLASDEYTPADYGLQFTHGADKKPFTHYVTEDNFNDIKDGYLLKLVHSLKYRSDNIFKELHTKSPKFKDLEKLSSDPGFIKQIMRENNDITIKRIILTNITGHELAICVSILTELLKLQVLKCIENELIICVLGSIKTNNSPNDIRFSVAFLKEVLADTTNLFEDIKKKIMETIRIEDLLPLLHEGFPKCQTSTILLINELFENVGSVELVDIYKELNSESFKNTVYKHIFGHKVSQEMAKALYRCQHKILRPLNMQFEHHTRLSTIIDYFNVDNLQKDSTNYQSKYSSMESLSELPAGCTRARLNTIPGDMIRKDSIILKEIIMEECNKRSINFLTVDCMEYFKNHFPQSFTRIKLEDHKDPDFYTISEDVVCGLCELLDIGKKVDKNKNLYQPLIFFSCRNKVFIYELFCFTMWLFAKTKCEMKAKSKDDYEKIITVVLKGIELVLQKHPIDYKTFKEEVNQMSYNIVTEYWDKENISIWKEVLHQNTSIQELKQILRPENEALIREERFNWMKKGEQFPKIMEKEKKGKPVMQCLKLSNNHATLYLGDWDEEQQNFKQSPEPIGLADIEHLIVRGACPHFKEHKVKDSNRCFSLQLENKEYLNFFAASKNSADHWIDGLNILLRKPDRTSTFQQELQELIKMDVSLHLLELQNIRIPTEAPPIPPDPSTPIPVDSPLGELPVLKKLFNTVKTNRESKLKRKRSMRRKSLK